MEVSPEFQDKYKQLLLKAFQHVIEFLDSHNLKWFCCYGTLIGAVRHSGLIPWDDDVDICMPKEDFDKLVAIKDELEKDHYKFLSFSDLGFYCPHCKIIDTNTTLWENEYYPFITGVFVDIFPLLNTDISGDEAKEAFVTEKSLSNLVMRTVKKIPFNYFLKSVLDDHDWKWREYLINMIKYPRSKNKYYLKKLQSFDSRLFQADGENAVCPAVLEYGEKELMKASYFSDYIEVPFEGFMVRIPVGYHEYLSQLYGDYMTPPPEEQRIPKHHYYYINLNEGLSLKEVKKRIKKGERVVF